MAKSIYTYYKERLIEIGGNNKCLFLKSIVRKNAYDIGRIFEGREDKVAELVEFLWTGRRFPLTLIGASERESILANLGIRDKDAVEGATEAEKKRLAKANSEARARAIENEIAKIKDLRREVEEIERETGRYENRYRGFRTYDSRRYAKSCRTAAGGDRVRNLYRIGIWGRIYYGNHT